MERYISAFVPCSVSRIGSVGYLGVAPFLFCVRSPGACVPIRFWVTKSMLWIFCDFCTKIEFSGSGRNPMFQGASRSQSSYRKVHQTQILRPILKTHVEKSQFDAPNGSPPRLPLRAHGVSCGRKEIPSRLYGPEGSFFHGGKNHASRKGGSRDVVTPHV